MISKTNYISNFSGCGKTTLLSLLSGQRRGKKNVPNKFLFNIINQLIIVGKGVLRINGKVVTGKMLRSNSAFLQQKDLFIESLTVYEHMAFMAAMCLNKPYSARVMAVHKLLKDLNIENLKYTKIQYLSTGEKRKLSLASNVSTNN